MRKIEDFSNWLTDMDWGWWPLLHLRPQKNERIDSRVVFKITPFFGTAVGLCYYVIWGIKLGTMNGIILSVASGWIFFFLAYRSTSAVAWNRRAARLRLRKNEDKPVDHDESSQPNEA